jgi:hypothetical protein
MEISFYGLLTLTNLSHSNKVCQELAGKIGVIQMIVNQLRSSHFEPKKTACLCLSNLIKDNQPNIISLNNCDGVFVLVCLINDKEDDDLSNKAY